MDAIIKIYYWLLKKLLRGKIKMDNWIKELKKGFKGDVLDDEGTLTL